jgi:hypothetical protein
MVMTIKHPLSKELDTIIRKMILRAVSTYLQKDSRMDALTNSFFEEGKTGLFEQLYDEIQDLFNQSIIEALEARGIKLTSSSINHFIKDRSASISRQIIDITDYCCAEYRSKMFASKYELSSVKQLTESEKKGTEMADGSRRIPWNIYGLLQTVSAEIGKEQKSLLLTIKSRFIPEPTKQLSNQLYK